MRPCSILLVSLLCISVVTSVLANDVNSGGQRGVVRAISAQTLGIYKLNIGGGFRYARDYSYLRGPNGTGAVVSSASGEVVSRESPHLLSGNVYAAYGLLPLWDLAIDLPMYYDVTGWQVNRGGIGDLEVATKLGFPFQKPDALFTHAYYLRLILPTGAKNRGYFPRHSYYLSFDRNDPNENLYTVGAVFFNPAMAWSLCFDRLRRPVPLRLHGNLGGVVAKKKSQSAVTAAVAIEATPVEFLTIFAEVSGESRVRWYTERLSVNSFDNDPLWVTPGLRFDLPSGLYIVAAGDFGISDGRAEHRTEWDRDGNRYSTKSVPTYGANIMLGWNGRLAQPDKDKDGIIDKIDKCPFEAEDVDGFQDDDGCPEPDNDQDGIADVKDKCPNEKATCDGCPIYDTDKDGLKDDVDKCVKDPEDKDGFQDDDGCPEPDNDQDGMADAKDKCPDMAEDADGFDDSDGCPDLDNDQDGIPDAKDKCPNVKGIPDSSGCPKTAELKRELILKGVTFGSGNATLAPMSFTILDVIVESMKDWPKVRLEIQGHTDSQGKDEVNLKLSQGRAESVRNYMASKGIALERLVPMGYGEARPISVNSTAPGRALNRRVEIHRID